MFESRTQGQDVKTEITKYRVIRSYTDDGRQLRINADGTVRIDRPISIDGRTIEIVHFQGR